MKPLLTLLFCVSFLCCCISNDKEQIEVAAHKYSTSEADTIYKYLELVDSIYVFTLSEEEALMKGVSKTGYKELEKSLSIVNQSIKEAIADSVDLSLFNPQILTKKEKKND